jgi:hypothetical protein
VFAARALGNGRRSRWPKHEKLARIAVFPCSKRGVIAEFQRGSIDVARTRRIPHNAGSLQSLLSVSDAIAHEATTAINGHHAGQTRRNSDGRKRQSQCPEPPIQKLVFNIGPVSPAEHDSLDSGPPTLNDSSRRDAFFSRRKCRIRRGNGIFARYTPTNDVSSVVQDAVAVLNAPT